MSIKDKLKSLASVISFIEKQFGAGSIMKLDPNAPSAAVPVISSGSLALDRALGVGGYPSGRIVEIYGQESSGKTTLALHAIAEAQRGGGVAAFIDAEHALDVRYAANLGVKVQDLLLSQPGGGEEALEIVQMLARSNAVDLIVLDSVAALIPKAELDGDMGDQHVGLQARLMSQAMRKLVGCLHKSRTTVIFINQIRMKIGVMFGSPETTSGGNALKFYSSMRLDVRRIGTVKTADAIVGSRTRIRVVKNKLAPPFRDAETEISFGRGINREGEIIDLAAAAGLVQRSGSWLSAGKERLGQGRERSCEYLRENPKTAERLMAGLSQPKPGKAKGKGTQRSAA